MDHLFERRLDSLELFKGDFLHAFRDTVELHGGQSAFREFVVHPGAVMVVPLLQGDDGQPLLVLERQFRYPLQQVMIEFPAGKLDPGELPFECAKRELREETGYSARSWARVGVLHPVISYSTEAIDVWFARDLTLGDRQLDQGEFLDVFLATPAEFLVWCRDGLVTDAKTLTAALWVQNYLSGTWALEWTEAI